MHIARYYDFGYVDHYGEASDAFIREKGYALKTRSAKPECFDLRRVNENGTEKAISPPLKARSVNDCREGLRALPQFRITNFYQ